MTLRGENKQKLWNGTWSKTPRVPQTSLKAACQSFLDTLPDTWEKACNQSIIHIPLAYILKRTKVYSVACCSRLNPGARGEHLAIQLSWMAPWLLVKRVCSVHLVERWGCRSWTAVMAINKLFNYLLIRAACCSRVCLDCGDGNK